MCVCETHVASCCWDVCVCVCNLLVSNRHLRTCTKHLSPRKVLLGVYLSNFPSTESECWIPPFARKKRSFWGRGSCNMLRRLIRTNSSRGPNSSSFHTSKQHTGCSQVPGAKQMPIHCTATPPGIKSTGDRKPAQVAVECPQQRALPFTKGPI